MTLGEYIKSYRQMHGMSQRKFAALSGLTNTYISNLERGINSNGSVTTPSLETYQAVAKATNCEAADLIALLDDPFRESKSPPPGVTGAEEKYDELRDVVNQLNLENAESLKGYALFLLHRHKSQDGQ